MLQDIVLTLTFFKLVSYSGGIRNTPDTDFDSNHHCCACFTPLQDRIYIYIFLEHKANRIFI